MRANSMLAAVQAASTVPPGGPAPAAPSVAHRASPSPTLVVGLVVSAHPHRHRADGILSALRNVGRPLPEPLPDPVDAILRDLAADDDFPMPPARADGGTGGIHVHHAVIDVGFLGSRTASAGAANPLFRTSDDLGGPDGRDGACMPNPFDDIPGFHDDFPMPPARIDGMTGGIHVHHSVLDPFAPTDASDSVLRALDDLGGPSGREGARMLTQVDHLPDFDDDDDFPMPPEFTD